MDGAYGDEDAPIRGTLEYVINHVFLPPQLPQTNDTDPQNEAGLTKLFHDTLTEFIDLLPGEDQNDWIPSSEMLKVLIEEDGSESPLRNLVQQLDDMDERDSLALHSTQHNAGLVVRKGSENFTIETFELSPTSKSVTLALGRLVRRFPGPVIAVSHARMQDLNFRQALTNYKSDRIQVMLAKIHRRFQKLDLIICDEVPWAEASYEFVTETMESARSLLARRWSTVKRTSESAGTFKPSELRRLKPQLHTKLDIPSLRPYLQRLHSIAIQPRDGKAFDGKCNKRSNRESLSLPDLGTLVLASDEEIRLCLMDLELWVSKSLGSWLDRHRNSESELVKLTNINWYKIKSAAAYLGSPENISLMILTLFLLWTALDQAAVFHYTLLKKFDHGFPDGLLDSLLLPKRHQMAQLRDAEKNLNQRKLNCLPANPSIFSDITSPKSFGAQYFDQSLMHQELKRRIELEANKKAEETKAELRRQKEKFKRLMAESNALTCEYKKQWYGRGRFREERTVHDARCTKCNLRDEAQSLKVYIHEWPLPSSEPAAKAVVYDLEVPELLRCWRSMTYQILADVLSPTVPPENRGKGIVFAEYEDLADYFKSIRDRHQFCSIKTPFSKTQPYQTVGEATEDSICRPNNLIFVMQDSKSKTATTEQLKKFDIHERCTLKLPPGCYETLQYALAGTNHTHNEVIAKQALCPQSLTVHELHAFTALRRGYRIQINIARELAARTLIFGAEEVHLLVLQSSLQAGPSAGEQVSRQSHVEIEEESFGKDLLDTLESGLKSMRLLTISLHDSIRRQCLNLLQRPRDITIDWLRSVDKLLHECSDEEEIAYLTLCAFDLSLICHCTFDVDARIMSSVLSTERNVAILVETITIAKGHWPVSMNGLTPLTRTLIFRFYRTSHTVEHVLKSHILNSPGGINQAIKQHWEGYSPGTPWSCLDKPEDRWLKTDTAGSDNSPPMTVHFNTLTGELLVNGAPLSRIPREYEAHQTYQRLFGNKILEVFPSGKGLHFETKNTVYGFEVHFALFEDELIVRAAHGHELYEVIPLTTLENDFPRAFVKDYVHWVHRGTDSIEWRPIDTKWTPSSKNWRILTPEDPRESRLISGAQQLIDIKSPTANAVYNWLLPIEKQGNIVITYNTETKETEIRLPRLNLDFVLRNKGLESKQFRGMIVDTSQHKGTLHGLQNKLVLKGIQENSRIVIIPQGNISYSRTGHHLKILIDTGENEKVSYHQYLIDKDLGQLTDSGNLSSRLFKLYLHALTSHCLPDTLTSRTGTEEALHGLRLASTRSFIALNQEQIERLKLLARLTPMRDYAPKGHKFMQTVTWDKDLSQLSQHEEFVVESHRIVAQAQSFRKFTSTPSDEKYSVEGRGASELRARAGMRNALFRVHPFGAEKFNANSDVAYSDARDSIINSAREHDAYNISVMVDGWSCNLEPYNDLLEEIRRWDSTTDEPLVDTESQKLKSLLAKLSKSAKGSYQQINEADEMYKKIYARLVVSGIPLYESALRASILPRLSPSILIGLLARFNAVQLTPAWKTAIVYYAMALANIQKAERLVACGKRDVDILNELTNVGHANWDPMEFPEWLLLELESNILIRPEQAQIAREMIAPRSGTNAIMQLNMGLGKSSVIVPLVSATLADGSKLARVIALKSLTEQMFQLLVKKLGGLIGRRVYRLPISRSLRPSLSSAVLIQKTYEACMTSGGILLVEPETLLSFELLGLDYLLSREMNPPEPEANLIPVKEDNNEDIQGSMYDTGRQLVHTQSWLYTNARDVLNESDEILSVKFELIHTLGIQQNISFSPDRWVAIQHVLGVVSELAREVSIDFPQGIKAIEGKAGAFPRVRILEETGGKSLLNKVARSICRDGMSSLAIWTYSQEEREVIFEYITNLQITKERAAILETKVFQTNFTKMTLLLLRGMFGVGVLEFVFAKKRWRVNYGLSLSRSMLAVPYHAKDNPSARSEFSHPDTATCLTCLSYYYEGLTDAQIRASFEELFLSDYAEEDYSRWIQRCEVMPNEFKQLAGINLRDKQQCSQELFLWLRYSKGLIDYYLEHLVFPKEMKEFGNKLSSSGWEIARQKTHPTTGFSGTNDSKYMLPTPIKQCELPEQLSTNADVLTCMLRPENKYDTTHLESLDVSSLLDVAVTMDPSIRVVLNVEAQLLEDNEKIASLWLEKVDLNDADAVIFFHENDLFVVNREGHKESLLVSPFLKQMKRCLVYLDEAHTRGTDLKMPPDYREICTLGPDLTKDRLAQGLDRKSLEEGVVCRGRFASVENLARAELASVRAKCREFELGDFGDSDLHEEQERELHPENEREQQVEAPPPARPYVHKLHDNIRRLVNSGRLLSDDGILPAFKVFDLTRTRELLDVDNWPRNLLISQGFYHTVQIPNEGNKDSFLRPVNWVLSFQNVNQQPMYLILSPFEVQELLPFMRGSEYVRLDVYTPRLSLSNRSLECLSFCSIPPVPAHWTIPEISTHLNLFSGQLYLRDETEYRTLCRFLGLRFKHPYQGVEVGGDGFISPGSRRLQD
ncbi:hypothetical protein HYALB_00008163 [Hymenoscyphus albidus]|uniref:ubiquitinyl hydrolase 1 n=1 Tax=Hymenoscyphus albidus TaxID=595503 RepID=A0A9N9M4R4_9HELO|nr:hypothetical protein HYALB_00008163 [Hymenoscyphus albidus]